MRFEEHFWRKTAVPTFFEILLSCRGLRAWHGHLIERASGGGAI